MKSILDPDLTLKRTHALQDLAADLAQITFDYPFRIPPYFALIIRAIGVLEGIALVGNPEVRIAPHAVLDLVCAHPSSLSKCTTSQRNLRFSRLQQR